jgi:hypothetical protein
MTPDGMVDRWHVKNLVWTFGRASQGPGDDAKLCGDGEVGQISLPTPNFTICSTDEVSIFTR